MLKLYQNRYEVKIWNTRFFIIALWTKSGKKVKSSALFCPFPKTSPVYLNPFRQAGYRSATDSFFSLWKARTERKTARREN